MSFWDSLHDSVWNQAYATWIGDFVALGSMVAAICAAVYAVKTYSATNASLKSAQQQLKLQMCSFYDSTMPLIAASLESPCVSWTKNLDEYGDFTKPNSGLYPIPIAEASASGCLSETFTIRLKNTSDNPAYVTINDLGEWSLLDPNTREMIQGEMLITSDRDRVITVRKQIDPIKDGYQKDAVQNFKCSLRITNRFRNTKDIYTLDSGDVRFMTWGADQGSPAGAKIEADIYFQDMSEKNAVPAGPRQYPHAA